MSIHDDEAEDSPPCIPPPPRPVHAPTMRVHDEGELVELIRALRADVANLRLEVAGKLTRLEGHLHSLRGDTIIIGADVAEIKTDVRQVDTKLEALRASVDAGHQILHGVRHLGESTFDMCKSLRAEQRDQLGEESEAGSRNFGE